MKRTITFLLFLVLCNAKIFAQSMPKEELIFLTSEWKGERFNDGRPKIQDNLIERAKHIGIEEAWTVLRNEGYRNQFEGNWKMVNDTVQVVGRVVTAQFMPARPDVEMKIKDRGKNEGRKGNTNSWPIDVLKDGDVYVADSYGKIADGTLIGDNLGNAIYAKSHRGVIFYGSVRDVEGLDEINGFNSWTKGNDPSYIQQMMLAGINVPIRIGRATVLPGDAVLAKKYGVVFIPAHLVDTVVLNAEFISLKDQFGHQRLREGKYTPGQIDTQWTEEIKKDFLQWLKDNPDKVPMTKEELDKFMKERNW